MSSDGITLVPTGATASITLGSADPTGNIGGSVIDMPVLGEE